MSRLNNLTMALAFATGALMAAKSIRRKSNAYNFKNKVTFITGGSRGLGLVVAKLLAAEGAKIAVCARDKEELLKAQQQLKEISDEIMVVPCDLTDRTQIHNAIHVVRENWGPIDVLINNAGTIQVGPQETMTVEDYEHAMQVHFWAPLYTSMSVIPQMKERGAGRIVNISSIGGKISVPHLLPYSASKFALTGLSEGLRSELKKSGIVVTTVCPGLLRTGSQRNITTKGKHKSEYAWFSVAGSSPVSSVSVTKAARKIVDACRYGDAELVISLPAKLAVSIKGLFPELTADFLQGINYILPEVGEEGSTTPLKGYESESFVAPSVLTALNEKAAVENNEN